MGVNLTGLKYEKNQNWSIDERLRHYSERFHLKTARGPILDDIGSLSLFQNFNYDQTFYSIQILTTRFHLKKEDDYSEGAKITRKEGELYASLVSSLTFLDPNDPDDRAADKFTAVRRPVLSRLDKYWQYMDQQIEEIDARDSSYKKKEMLYFGNCLNEALPRIGRFRNESKQGIIRTTATVGWHNSSVVIRPSDPKDAIAVLFGDQARTLFAEYDEKGSAEIVVKQFYGTDGIYAEHYRNALNCKDRYPSQKHLLV